MSVAALRVQAQTRFEWPDSKVDVSSYQYLEDCYGAAQRVQDSVYARTAVFVDTIPFARRTAAEPLPTNVIAIAQRCIDKYPVSQIPIGQSKLAQELFLIAGRDVDAAAVIQRHLTAFPANDTLARAFFLDTTARTYLAAVPARLMAAKPLVDEITSFGSVYPFNLKIGLYWAMMQSANALKNDTLMHHYGNALLAVAHNMTDEQRSSPSYRSVPLIVWTTIRVLHRADLMDSLRSSTEAFVSFQQAQYMQAMGNSDPELPIGKPAPILKGDFWFPDSASKISYPQRGKVSVIVFVAPNIMSSNHEQVRQAILHRFAQRYSNIDLIFVAGTQGWFGPLEPPDPKRESQLMDTLFRRFQGFPAVLTVSTSRYIRLPDPDRRRVYQQIENAEDYPGIDVIGRLYLVDQEGLLVSTDGIDIRGEDSFAEMVDILLKRPMRPSSE